MIWWFCRHRKKASYFTWLGFKKPKIEVKWWIAVIVASMIGQLDVSIVFHIVMFSFTFIAGLFMGFINEKICNGSIWASILLHGTVNFINSMFVAFGVF